MRLYRIVPGTMAALLVMGIASSPAAAAPGSLDRSFGRVGIVTTRFGRYAASAEAVAMQSDGKVVAVGDRFGPGNFQIRFAVARYDHSGGLDPSFGDDGKVSTNFGSSWGMDEARSVAVQADGKIVVAGDTGDDLSTRWAIARYDPDGTLDPSFGGTGKVITDFDPDPDVPEYALGVALQPDGKIVVAGDINQGKFALARYNDDGTLDSSFDTDGMVTTKLFRGSEEANALAIQDDGAILVVGHIRFSHFAVVRYAVDGTLDSTFGGDGVVLTNVGRSGYEMATSLAVQANGRIVVGGWAHGDFAMVRYRPDGTRDDRFGRSGKVVTNFPVRSAGWGIGLEPDGTIVEVGNARQAFALARYRRSGRLDPTFGAGGLVTTSIGLAAFGSGLAIAPNGKIVVAGSANMNGERFALVRYRS